VIPSCWFLEEIHCLPVTGGPRFMKIEAGKVSGGKREALSR